MKAIVKHYVKKDNGRDTLYQDGKPVTTETTVNLPLRFGYGSYNEPRKLMGTDIDSDDILEIKPADVPRIYTPFVDPHFTINGHTYTEYQVRQIMLMVAKGEIKESLEVTDNFGNKATIMPSGCMNVNLPTMLFNDDMAMQLLSLNNH